MAGATNPSPLVWVRVLIWMLLTALSVAVLFWVFSGGRVREREGRAFGSGLQSPDAPGRRPGGEMAYDRFRPGNRQGPPSAPENP